MARSFASALGELATLSAESRDAHEYMSARAAWLKSTFDFDALYQGAAFRARPLAASVNGVGRSTMTACEAHGYWPDRHRINRRALARGGVALDDDLLTTKERQELPFYREVMRALRLRSTLIGLVTMRGEVLSCVYLGWTTKHRPSERTRARLRAALPLLALGERAHPPDRPNLPAVPGISAREREVLSMLARGLTNLEIARLLGTAPNTVKNQVSSLLRKTGTSNRSELAFWAASYESPLPRP
jgi:DNA-binding CsgD family transcriptional regulator